MSCKVCSSSTVDHLACRHSEVATIRLTALYGYTCIDASQGAPFWQFATTSVSSPWGSNRKLVDDQHLSFKPIFATERTYGAKLLTCSCAEEFTYCYQLRCTQVETSGNETRHLVILALLSRSPALHDPDCTHSAQIYPTPNPVAAHPPPDNSAVANPLLQGIQLDIRARCASLP